MIKNTNPFLGVFSYEKRDLTTRDGWKLAIHHFEPARSTLGPPVLVLPGHGTSAWTLFAGPDSGIAGALARAGRDVWILDPRGSGESLRADSTVVRIEDKLRIDLPSFISAVSRWTGHDSFDAVGHSLGGVLLYLHELGSTRTPFRRKVTLGSPLRISRALVPPVFRTRTIEACVRQVGRLPLRGLAARVRRRAKAEWLPMHFDPRHLDTSQLDSFFRFGVSDTHGHELSELIRWVRTGCASTFHPELRAGQPLRRLSSPTRFLVGAKDGLTTPEAVRHAFEQIGTPSCEYLELGRATGASVDYRHTDILVGREVASDISPYVVEWLNGGLAARKSRPATGFAETA
ncbi:MAG: alpha/beta fold hydrolase [Myxococcales bacterium]|nr:alpha/beta fold hydrolase [Myxococcales bacterium]